MDHLSLSSVVAFVTTNTTRLVILIWDITLTLINLLVPAKRLGHVIPAGHPGAGGKWPKYIAPADSDSRSACPALNAMANHGILPRDGRNIKFSELSRATHTTFNFAETFCFVVCNFSAGMLSKTYDKGTCDLADLNMHNGIEHDASLTRDDAVHQPDQGKPYTPFVEELLHCATGKDENGQPKLTARDLSYFMAKRRVEAQKTNPQYSFTMFHRAFSFLNTSFLLTGYGGRVGDLQKLLIEERLPEGWEPACRQRMGVTLSRLAVTGVQVELGADFGAGH
ncbi:Chloroperoxidase [Lyophyllum atratum]|nr:Chloroperoxidase [Lyophyllum atratum]